MSASRTQLSVCLSVLFALFGLTNGEWPAGHGAWTESKQREGLRVRAGGGKSHDENFLDL
jgi:hypothetical protein